jgi:hypothetical protein
MKKVDFYHVNFFTGILPGKEVYKIRNTSTLDGKLPSDLEILLVFTADV